MSPFRGLIVTLLSPLMMLPPAGAQGPVKELSVLVLEGNNAVNVIPMKRGVPPVVEVRDRDERPIEGAQVTFELPAAGPSAIFPGNKRTLTVKTNVQGQALAAGMEPNSIPGAFSIRVTASFGSLTAETTVNQQNAVDLADAIRPPGKGRKKWYLLLGGGAAAAGAGLYFGLRGNGSSASTPTPTPTITVTPGTVTVGGPR
ncbi:MAG: hypothetical protein SFV54_10895 [Bryobacteraceae bacterium]|nr:hypothetical protein [Bryobacteraceae bacterium]